MIAHGPTRGEAVAALRRALAERRDPRAGDQPRHARRHPRRARLPGRRRRSPATSTTTRTCSPRPSTTTRRTPTSSPPRSAGEHARRRRHGRWSFAPSGWRNVRTQGQRSPWRGLRARHTRRGGVHDRRRRSQRRGASSTASAHRPPRRLGRRDRWAIELDGVRRADRRPPLGQRSCGPTAAASSCRSSHSPASSTTATDVDRQRAGGAAAGHDHRRRRDGRRRPSPRATCSSCSRR